MTGMGSASMTEVERRVRWGGTDSRSGAGMTEKGAGVTEKGAGMTEVGGAG